ncbi:hypothetical protein RND71_035107 [Anisodus tanguticus]|uniref:Uncharacterized protein n=1 Tax=Anisodus tanguticus TaxID=243964 RepID=A0AAE1R4W6_9SOLA|nr:hypothetical protein RND71_035107 [Anisodus tanguticus]
MHESAQSKLVDENVSKEKFRKTINDELHYTDDRTGLKQVVLVYVVAATIAKNWTFGSWRKVDGLR